MQSRKYFRALDITTSGKASSAARGAAVMATMVISGFDGGVRRAGTMRGSRDKLVSLGEQ